MVVCTVSCVTAELLVLAMSPPTISTQHRKHSGQTLATAAQASSCGSPLTLEQAAESVLRVVCRNPAARQRGAVVYHFDHMTDQTPSNG